MLYVFILIKIIIYTFCVLHNKPFLPCNSVAIENQGVVYREFTVSQKIVKFFREVGEILAIWAKMMSWLISVNQI